MSEQRTWHYLNYCSLLKASMPCSMRCKYSATNEWRNLRQWWRSLRILLFWKTFLLFPFPVLLFVAAPSRFGGRFSFKERTYTYYKKTAKRFFTKLVLGSTYLQIPLLKVYCAAFCKDSQRFGSCEENELKLEQLRRVSFWRMSTLRLEHCKRSKTQTYLARRRRVTEGIA